jgi:hypothetical protein
VIFLERSPDGTKSKARVAPYRGAKTGSGFGLVTACYAKISALGRTGGLPPTRRCIDVLEVARKGENLACILLSGLMYNYLSVHASSNSLSRRRAPCATNS